MKTDDLITLIALDAKAHRPSMHRRLLVATGLGCFAAAIALLATIGVRPDIHAALGTWRFDAKLLSVAFVLAAAWMAARELSRPEAQYGKALRLLLVPMLFLLGTMLAELMSTASSTWTARAIGSNAQLCLVAILLFAAAPLLFLLAALREGAPRSPALAGAAAGLLAGCVGAFFYAVHCPDDSPLFVALWYTPPVLVVAMVGAAIGRPVLRW